MNKAVQSFINNVSEKKHVLHLIEKNDLLTVGLNSRNERVAFIIKKGEIKLRSNLENSSCDYEIIGEVEAIRDLLTGNESLRQLAKKGRIENTPHFRITLLLESLFILTNPRKTKI